MFKYSAFSKYKAQKTIVDGIEFDSKKEANRYLDLKYLEKIGEICNLQRQVPFLLQEGFVNNKGKKIREINYIADFVYEQNDAKIVEDTKGFKTSEYLLKKKMFMYKYRDYEFIES